MLSGHIWAKQDVRTKAAILFLYISLKMSQNPIQFVTCSKFSPEKLNDESLYNVKAMSRNFEMQYLAIIFKSKI